LVIGLSLTVGIPEGWELQFSENPIFRPKFFYSLLRPIKMKASSVVDYEEEDEEEDADIAKAILELESNLHDWVMLREENIIKLKEIANYVDRVSKKGIIARAIGSGTGIVAGGLTIIGGALTIATGGLAAVPILIAGTGVGIAAGVTGGAAAITEKIIKSRQMKAARLALEADKDATAQLEQQMTQLSKNGGVMKKVAKDLVMSGGQLTNKSFKLAGLLTASSSGLFRKGIEASAGIIGDDVAREVSKIFLMASGRIVSGSITVVLGGVTMAYDIYKLTTQVEEFAKLGSDGATDLRTIAFKLEEVLIGIKNQEQSLSEHELKSHEQLPIVDQLLEQPTQYSEPEN
jgi:hypothetical protein